MEEIGLKLKEAREEHGVTIEEAAADLNIRISQLQNIEDGNLKAFKDVFYLKSFIRGYAKYLGLDEEKIMDAVNEYFFEATSKIPVKEIQKASKEKEKLNKENKKVSSPYTTIDKPRSKVITIIVILIILLLLFLIVFVIVTQYVNTDKKSINDELTYMEE